MERLLVYALTLVAIIGSLVAANSTVHMPIQPPVAEKHAHQSVHHGVALDDPWHWLRDADYPEVDDPEVLAYLKAENAYFESVMEPRKALVENLYEELKGRIQEDESSVPQRDGEWIYWERFEVGGQYRKHFRKAVSGGEEKLILDENVLAEGKEYFQLNDVSVSPDGRLMAYAFDDNGSERFTIRVRDLETGEELPDVIPNTLSSIVWSADGGGIVYGVANANWRVDNAFYHRLGESPKKAKRLYKEKDIGFSVDVDLSAQKDWIIIGTGDQVTSEVRLVPASDPLAEPILVSARREGRNYVVDVREGELFVVTNDEHVNFRVATAKLDAPGEWKTLIAGSDRHYITSLVLFKDFYVVEGRIDGLDEIEVRDYADVTRVERIEFPESSYTAEVGDNPEYEASKLRIDYESMVTPETVYDYDVVGKRLEVLKVQEIPSGYDAAKYETERLMIEVRDGTRVPVSVLFRKGFQKNGGGPLHLYGYGAYGLAISPGFSAERLSLVDRGFAYAIAHVRGGDDLGYQWYLDGKLTKRTNAFYDFVDVAKGLIALGYVAEGRLTASGRSAGGELMGVVVNEAPELFGAVALHVPFVDVLNTMLDETLPLTPGEWPEWGNPIADKAVFDLIRSYSPYDNVSAKAYPPMFFTAGLNDPRVTYWEPAKMVAKLRALKTDEHVLLLKTHMEAGHGGKSGRFEHLREVAEEAAFLLWQLGLAK